MTIMWGRDLNPSNLSEIENALLLLAKSGKLSFCFD